MTAWSLWPKDICRSFQSTFCTHIFSFCLFCGRSPPLVCSKKVECSSIRLRSADEDFPPTRLRPIPLCASELLSCWIVKCPICFDAFGSTWAHRNPPANLCIYPAACSVSEIINEYQRTGASGSRNDDRGALIMSLFFFIRLTEVKFCFIRPKNFVPQHCLTFVHFCELMLGLSVSESYQMLHAFILETIEDLCSHKWFFFSALFKWVAIFKFLVCTGFFFFRRKPTVDFTFDISLWQILPCYLILLTLSLSLSHFGALLCMKETLNKHTPGSKGYCGSFQLLLNLAVWAQCG